MKKLLLGTAIALLASASAYAGDIGVSMANSDTFLTVLRKGIEKSAADANQPVQIEIADDDVQKQLSQIQNFIAAKVDATDKDYFEQEIRPLLDHPLIDFVGEVDHQRKVELLCRARALLFPIDWPEPFGLVMIEAMACGTPVVTRPCGAVPEIVAHGRTGLVGSSVDELVDAVKGVKRLDRRACRQEVEQRFNASRMATDYETVYRRLLDTSHSAP